MEKRYKREEELIKKLLDEAGSEKPSSDFKSRLMMKLEARNIELKPYKPLISGSIWVGIACLLLVAMASLYLLDPETSISYEINLNFLQFLDFPQINLSRNMQYAIAFIALFFLQVPFLKRFIDREYSL